MVMSWNFCSEAAEVFGPIINELSTSHNSTIVCSQLKFCRSPNLVIDSELGYVRRILRDKPVKPYVLPQNRTKPLKLLIFTDPHFDFDYLEVSHL